jgi:hypothetical protein
VLPEIDKIKSLDVYRDGGSLSVSFLGKDNNEHTLLFGIDMFVNSKREFIKRGYKVPVLESYIRDDYVSPIIGISNRRYKKEENNVSWTDSCILLKKLSSQVKTFESEYSWVFPKMVAIAGNEGKLDENS